LEPWLRINLTEYPQLNYVYIKNDFPKKILLISEKSRAKIKKLTYISELYLTPSVPRSQESRGGKAPRPWLGGSGRGQ